MRKKRPTPEEKIVTIINKMFEIAGHEVTYNDIKDRKDAWYTDWTMTMEQDEEWKKWMQEYFIKECKMVKGLVSREAAMVSLMWGLKISDYDK
jgi:hypothetical protein